MRSVKLNNNFIKRFVNGLEGGTQGVYGIPVNSKFVNAFETDANLNEYRNVNDLEKTNADVFHIKRGAWQSFDGFEGSGVLSATKVSYTYTKVEDSTEVEQPMFVTNDNFENFKSYYAENIKNNLDNINSYIEQGGFYWIRTIEELKWCANRVNGEDGSAYNNKIIIVLGDNIIGNGSTKEYGQTKAAFDYINKMYYDDGLKYPHEIIDFKIGASLDIPFEGIFDGNYYKIGNITIYADGDYNGLFGILGVNGVIRNLIMGEVSLIQRNKLNLSHISKYGTDIVVGALCGKNMGTIENVSYDKENGKNGVEGSMVTVEGFFPEVYAVENKSDDNLGIDDINLQSKRLLYMQTDRGICSMLDSYAKISINHSTIYNTETSGTIAKLDSKFNTDKYVGSILKAIHYTNDYATSGTYDYSFDLTKFSNKKWTADVARSQCTSGYIPLTPFLKNYVDEDSADIDKTLQSITDISDTKTKNNRPSSAKIGTYLVGNFSAFTSAHNSNIQSYMDEINNNTQTSSYMVSPHVDDMLSTQYYDVNGIQDILCSEPSVEDLSDICKNTYWRFIKNQPLNVQVRFLAYLVRLKNAKVIDPAMFPTDNRTDSIAIHNITTSADNLNSISNWHLYVPTEDADNPMWECSIPHVATENVFDYTKYSYNNNCEVPYTIGDVTYADGDNDVVYMLGTRLNDGTNNSVSGCRGFIYYEKENINYNHAKLANKIGKDLSSDEVNSVMMVCADSVNLDKWNYRTEYNRDVSADSKYLIEQEWGSAESGMTLYGRDHYINFKKSAFYELDPSNPTAQLVLPNSNGSITCIPCEAELAVVLPSDTTFIRYRKTNVQGVVQTYYVPLNHRMYFIKVKDSKSAIINPISNFNRNRPNYRKAVDTSHKNYNYLNSYCIDNPVNYCPYCGYFAQGPVYSTRLGGSGKLEDANGSQFILLPMFLSSLYHNNTYHTYDVEHNVALYQQDMTKWGDKAGGNVYYGKWLQYKIDYRKDVYGFQSKDSSLSSNVYNLRADYSVAPYNTFNESLSNTKFASCYGKWANELANASRISMFHLPWYGIDTHVKQIAYAKDKYSDYTNSYNGISQSYTYSGSLFARMFSANINLHTFEVNGKCDVIREDDDNMTSSNDFSGQGGGMLDFIPYAKKNRSIPLGNDGRQAYYVSPFVGLNCGTIRNVYVNVTTYVEKPFVGFYGTICAYMDRGTIDNFYAYNQMKYRQTSHRNGNKIVPENDKYYVIHDENLKVSFLDSVYNKLSSKLIESINVVNRFVLNSIFNLGTIARLQVSKGISISNGYMNVISNGVFGGYVYPYDMYDYNPLETMSYFTDIDSDMFSRYSPFISVCDLNKSRYGQIQGTLRYTDAVKDKDKMHFANLYIDYDTGNKIEWQSSFIAEQRTTNDVPSIIHGYIGSSGLVQPEDGMLEGKEYCRIGWWQNDYPMYGNAIYCGWSGCWNNSNEDGSFTMYAGACGVNRYISSNGVYSIMGGKKKFTSTDYNISEEYYYSMGYISGNAINSHTTNILQVGQSTADALNYYYFSSPYGSFVAFNDILANPNNYTRNSTYYINPKLVVFVMKRPYTNTGVSWMYNIEQNDSAIKNTDYTKALTQSAMNDYKNTMENELYSAMIAIYNNHDSNDGYFYYTYTKEESDIDNTILSMTLTPRCDDNELTFSVLCGDTYYDGKESADNIVYNHDTISWGYSLSPRAIRDAINKDGYAKASGIIASDFRGILLLDSSFNNIIGFIDNGNGLSLNGGAYTLRFEKYSSGQGAKFIKLEF